MQDKDRLENQRGLDKEIQAKLAAKFDQKKATACLEWIAGVTGKSVTNDFHADLKDGYLLCMLVKKISPKTCKKHKLKAKKTTQPFTCRTQIQGFVAVCKDLGMKDTDVCTPNDLFDGDN